MSIFVVNERTLIIRRNTLCVV